MHVQFHEWVEGGHRAEVIRGNLTPHKRTVNMRYCVLKKLSSLCVVYLANKGEKSLPALHVL